MDAAKKDNINQHWVRKVATPPLMFDLQNEKKTYKESCRELVASKC